MLIAVTAALAFALFVYGVFVTLGRRRAILTERLETYAGIEEEAALAADAEMKNLSTIPRIVNIVAGRNFIRKLEEELAQADVPMRPVEYVLLRFVLGGLGMVISLLILPDPRNQSILIVRTLGLLFLGYLTPAIAVRVHKYRRRNKFVTQLADALMLLTNSLRSGYGFLKGLELVAKEMGNPISKELNRMLREINLGATVDQAFLNLGRRVNSQDLDIVISAYLIQKDVGGNLTEIMEKVAETIRERLKIQGDIRVLTAQGRLSGLIVGLLPLGLFAFFMLNTPDYFAPMMGPPRFAILPGFDVPVGVIVLCLTFIWQCLGGLLIYKIIDIKV